MNINAVIVKNICMADEKDGDDELAEKYMEVQEVSFGKKTTKMYL